MRHPTGGHGHAADHRSPAEPSWHRSCTHPLGEPGGRNLASPGVANRLHRASGGAHEGRGSSGHGNLSSAPLRRNSRLAQTHAARDEHHHNALVPMARRLWRCACSGERPRAPRPRPPTRLGTFPVRAHPEHPLPGVTRPARGPGGREGLAPRSSTGKSRRRPYNSGRRRRLHRRDGTRHRLEREGPGAAAVRHGAGGRRPRRPGRRGTGRLPRWCRARRATSATSCPPRGTPASPSIRANRSRDRQAKPTGLHRRHPGYRNGEGERLC
jgi:hypothetical protein